MKKLILLLLVTAAGIFLLTSSFSKKSVASPSQTLWNFQSVDTMKYSRDVSREKLHDPSFDIVISKQVADIAGMGATHVAIATPYDEEFLPILKRWVTAARRHKLKVWFRGNWSGWEGWFGYPEIDRAAHIEKTNDFIRKHPDLFVDGDIFSACPECENGGPGDPRLNGDAEGHKRFLIEEYEVTKKAFKAIGKDVTSNYDSMNGDVARLIMDPATTEALDGLVVIDHYVGTPDVLVSDIQEIARASGGNIVLGEFGAPIGDIHGQMTEDEQAAWIQEAMAKLLTTPQLKGVSYWVNVGGSTSLFNDDQTPRKAASVIKSFFDPEYATIKVLDPLGGAVTGLTVTTLNRQFTSVSETVKVPRIEAEQRLVITAKGYNADYAALSGSSQPQVIILEPTEENMTYKIRRLLKLIFRI